MFLPKSQLIPNKTIQISGSKSESNRLLVLQSLIKNILIKNLSNSQDTQLLQKALASNEGIIDIHLAGTAMRFLTAYFSIQEGKEKIITGSKRMKERPIEPLVTALRNLGADIKYLEKEGFPPLKIIGKKLTKNYVEIPADISSQFITALMLIGVKIENGLNVKLLGKITSRPYLEMTINQLNEITEVRFDSDTINIAPIVNYNPSPIQFIIESDWSSASYFYSTVAIGRQPIILKNFKKNSLQGDSDLANIYKKFLGIETIFNNDESISIVPLNNFKFPDLIELDMNHCPDIAQTLCVTTSVLNIPFKITGLETLKIKETDRLKALHTELKKIGTISEISENSIRSVSFVQPTENISISTYNDHRMAMSFAPYSLISNIKIENPKVVQKSYPKFWEDYHTIIKPI